MAVFCPLETAWGDVGTWVSGIGSLAAVAVALYLANRSDRPNAKAYLSVLIATPNLDEKIVAFQVSNLGTHPLRISSCFMEYKRWLRFFVKWPSAMANNWQHDLNWRLPADVERGATFFYGTTGDGFIGYLADSKLPAWAVVRSIRAGVSTPWGPIYVRLGRDTLDYLRERLVLERVRRRAATVSHSSP